MGTVDTVDRRSYKSCSAESVSSSTSSIKSSLKIIKNLIICYNIFNLKTSVEGYHGIRDDQELFQVL